MPHFIARLLTSLVLILLIFCASRGLVRALPGDPLETLLAESGTTIPAAELRIEMGLDRPFLEALMGDLERFAHGDLGKSLFSHEPVTQLLARRMVRTVQLTTLAFLFALTLSLSIGLVAAAHPGRKMDRFCTFYGALTAAFPTPWLGPLLLITFTAWIPIFPTGQNIFLPSLTLSIAFSGLWSRLIRERVRETLTLGAAPGARARGLPEATVVIKYGLWPCSGALLAYLGTQFGALLAGAIVTEVIFDWRGMGSLFIEAVLKRDYPVIEAATFVSAAASFGGSMLGDWAQSWVDPRLRGVQG